MRLIVSATVIGLMLGAVAHAYVIHTNAINVKCELQNPGTSFGKLIIYNGVSPIQERDIGSLSLTQATGAAAWCNSVINDALAAYDSGPITHYVLIDSNGKIDDGSLIKTELKPNCK